MENICQKCGKCCLETEMIISIKDIERIISNLEHVCKEDFGYKNRDGFYQLKNNDGRCIFYNAFYKSCKIYEYRPQGCRLYPLVYHTERKKCIIDGECPSPEVISFIKQNKIKLCNILRKYLRKELNIH